MSSPQDRSKDAVRAEGCQVKVVIPHLTGVHGNASSLEGIHDDLGAPSPLH